MPWKFVPTQREVRVRPGESALAFYTAENRSSTPITGVSTYNVTPMKAMKTWKKSMPSRIVQLTEEAQLSKPRLQSWLDKFGEHYSKAVVVLSFAAALLGAFLFKWPFSVHQRIEVKTEKQWHLNCSIVTWLRGTKRAKPRDHGATETSAASAQSTTR